MPIQLFQNKIKAKRIHRLTVQTVKIQTKITGILRRDIENSEMPTPNL